MRRAINVERHQFFASHMSQEVNIIVDAVEAATGDKTLRPSLYVSATFLTQVKRTIWNSGLIIADSQIVANDIDRMLVGEKGAKVVCYIDDPTVLTLASQRRVTRAEVAVDVALMEKGPKLFVVGSAPAAIQSILMHRSNGPLTDVGILAASTGYASAIQLKEQLIDSSLPSLVVRGKKGGPQTASVIMNTILKELNKNDVHK